MTGAFRGRIEEVEGRLFSSRPEGRIAGACTSAEKVLDRRYAED
jgi:hypothetical protein